MFQVLQVKAFELGVVEKGNGYLINVYFGIKLGGEVAGSLMCQISLECRYPNRKQQGHYKQGKAEQHPQSNFYTPFFQTLFLLNRNAEN